MHGNPYVNSNLNIRPIHQYVFNPSDMYIAQLRGYYLKTAYNPYNALNISPSGMYKVYKLLPLFGSELIKRVNASEQINRLILNAGYDEDSSMIQIQLFDYENFISKRKMVYIGELYIDPKTAAQLELKKELINLSFIKNEYLRRLNVFKMKLAEHDLSKDDISRYEHKISKILDYIRNTDKDINTKVRSVDYSFSATPTSVL